MISVSSHLCNKLLIFNRRFRCGAYAARWKDSRRDALIKEIEEAERNDMYAENRLLPTDEG